MLEICAINLEAVCSKTKAKLVYARVISETLKTEFINKQQKQILEVRLTTTEKQSERELNILIGCGPAAFGETNSNTHLHERKMCLLTQYFGIIKYVQYPANDFFGVTEMTTVKLLQQKS